MTAILTWLVLAVVLAAIVIAVLTKCYQRGTREISLIRTGLGGR